MIIFHFVNPDYGIFLEISPTLLLQAWQKLLCDEKVLRFRGFSEEWKLNLKCTTEIFKRLWFRSLEVRRLKISLKIHNTNPRTIRMRVYRNAGFFCFPSLLLLCSPLLTFEKNSWVTCLNKAGLAEFWWHSVLKEFSSLVLWSASFSLIFHCLSVSFRSIHKEVKTARCSRTCYPKLWRNINKSFLKSCTRLFLNIPPGLLRRFTYLKVSP